MKKITNRPRCQACGSTYGVEEHHLTFRSKFGKRKKDKQELTTNKIWLCNKHHAELHAKLLFVLKESGHMYFISRSKLEKMKDWSNVLEIFNVNVLGENNDNS